MERESIKTLIIQLRKRDVSMRTILTILLILFAFNIQAQSLKKNDPIYLYALSIDARITNGDKRMPKRVIVNNGIFNEVNELQTSNYSKKLDSIIKKLNGDLSTKEIQYDSLEKVKSIKAKKILPYLKNKPTIYKGSDWSLEVSGIIFSDKGNKAILAMRTSSNTEVLDISIHYFEFKDGKWILSKELSPFLF